MDSRQENIARDEQLDEQIDRMLSGKGGANESQPGGVQVAREFTRLAAEESPRMSSGARAQGLEALRARAGQKRAARRPSPLAFLSRVPRWAQIGAVALVVVVLVNGVSIAAADALPGSLLYPFKRITEGGQLLLQNSNGQRAQLWMNLANTRLDELQRLLNTGGQVDPSALDAVDESILRALTELAGTRGEERIALLQELTALAIRQQEILRQMAQSVSPADRTRLEQTERLLQGVANYASSPDAVRGSELSPLQFLTPTITPTVTPTPTNTTSPLPSLTPTGQPSFTPVPVLVTDPVDDHSINAMTSLNDNANGDDNANDNGTGNGNGNDGNDTSSGNSNANDNTGNDHTGNDNGDDAGGDNGNDNGDDNSDDTGNDNSDDNQGGGDGGTGNDDRDDGGNDNGDNDNDSVGGGDNGSDNSDDKGGNGNDGGGQDDDNDKGDNDNNKSGDGGGDNGNDKNDDDKGGNGDGGGGQDDDTDDSGNGNGDGGGGGDDKDDGGKDNND